MGGGEYDAGGWEDFPEDALHGVTIGECKVLLVRRGDGIDAVSGVCPHAGADLAEGVLQDGIVTCPWHKAGFSMRDGACTAPPALDDLPRFAARVVDGRVLVRLPGSVARVPSPGAVDTRCMVIVGAGAAGANAAQTLRAEGFSGRVVMVGREDRLPYDRTVLSKYALSGETGAEKTPLQSAYFYNKLAIERRCGVVAAIEPAARRVRFEDGASLAYDAVLVATGAAPRRPGIAGRRLDGVFVLRSAADAEAVAEAAGHASSCVVMGAGFIGMEVAAALCERGLQVHVVAEQEAPFAAVLGARVGWAVAALHQARGIVFHMGCSIASLAGDRRLEGVVLDDGTRIEAGMLVIGMGVTPETSLLAFVPKRDDGGVTVDAGLMVRDGVFAAGDIAAFPLYGVGTPVRVEHWRVAAQQGRVAALNMLGGQARFTAAPVFWTIHFRKRLDYVGHAEHWDEIVVDGDLEERRFLAFYVVDGAVAALAGMDRDREMAAATAMFEARQDWSVAGLRDALGRFAG